MKQAFDDYAQIYDADFSEATIGKAQRKQVWQYLKKHLNPNKKVLEINCGTGVDALWMAPQVKNILATDISEGMLKACNKKLTLTSISNLSFQILDLRKLGTFHSKNFDLIFSNFAGLNCLSKEELLAFGKHAEGLLNTNGKLVLVFLGKKCWWESVYFKLKKDKREGRRLKLSGTNTNIDGINFTTWYYSLKDIENMFSDFNLVEAHPIGLIIPPSFMEKRFKSHNWLIELFRVVEKSMAIFSSLSDYGDHLLVVLQKKNHSTTNF